MDGENADAQSKLESIEPVREAILNADDLMEEGDFRSAELYLTKAVDVSVIFCCGKLVR